MIVQSWKMSNDYGIADTTGIDTSQVNYPLRNALNDHSISWAYNGNLISPSQSKVYFDRSGNGMLGNTGTGSDVWQRGGLGPTGRARKKMDMVFASAYEPYIFTAQDVQFYRTSAPYSAIGYKKGFATAHQENDLNFIFTGNLNQKTNIGTNLVYLNSPGRYSSQQGKDFGGYVFGSYDGNNYGLHASVCFNNMSMFENGGLQDPSQMDRLKPEDLPTKLQAMSGFKHISGFLDHHYSITTDREVKLTIKGKDGEEDRDSVYTEHVPVITINHVFETNNSTRRYVEKNANQDFFPEWHLNRSQTNDTASVLNIRNTIAVTFNEEFNRLLKFGVTAYVTNECQRFVFPTHSYDPTLPVGIGIDDHRLQYHSQLAHTDTVFGQQWLNYTWVGGAIYKNNGKYLRFGVNGDICLLGNSDSLNTNNKHEKVYSKLWEFQVNGHVDADFRLGKNKLYVRATAYVKNETPDYYLYRFRSNHYIWNNEFKKTYRVYAGGEISFPTEWVKPRVRVGFENLTNYIYFDKNGLPVQKEGSIQVLSGDARIDLTTPWLNMENSVVVQFSDSILPLPTVALYSNLYYHGWWFKAMYAQIGVDCRFHTAYRAPLYNPATAQFCVQDEVMIGNYPVLNLYGNFYVKLLHLRFFFQWQNFGSLFLPNSENLSMPDYAMNPSNFRAGLAFHFWK